MPSIVSAIVDVYVFRVAANGVEFLLLQRAPRINLGSTWQAVHGKIEPAETAVAAARRELLEETGLTPQRFWQLDCVNTFYMASQDAIHMCPCFAADVDPAAGVRLSDEHVAFRWVPAEAAEAAFMWPGQREAVRQVLSYLVAGSAAEAHLRLPAAR